MLDTTSLKNAQLDKKIKDTAFIGIMAVCALSWGGFMFEGIVDIMVGVILIGLNLVRRQHGVVMGRGSFMIGAFLLIMAMLEGTTLYNPVWLPMLGLILAATAIFDGLQKN